MPAISPRTAPAEITLSSAASAGRHANTITSTTPKARIIAPPYGREQRGPAQSSQIVRVVASALRVPGFARQHAEVDADLLQRPLVFAAGVGAEDQIEVGRAVQPAVMLDLVLELAGRPAGIAEREDRALGTVAARDRLEDVERRGQADALVDRQRRVLDEEVARVQDEAALWIDRTTLEHLDPAGTRRQPDHVGGRNDVELYQQVGKADMRRRVVDDDAHGTFGRMRTDIDHAAGESLVAHARHCDQHLSVEEAALGTAARLRPRFRRRGPGDPLVGGRFARGVRRIRIGVGRGDTTDSSHAWLTTEFHVEMLPDCRPIANAAADENVTP